MMRISYHGHSSVSVETRQNVRLLFDPFITDDQLTDLIIDDVTVDYILITHAYGDCLSDMIEIAKKNDATVISNSEIVCLAKQHGVKNTQVMVEGSSCVFPFGRVKRVPAKHRSGYKLDTSTSCIGAPSGYIVECEGKTIYHAGDTSEFSEMKLIGDEFNIDVAFLPIGDGHIMGPLEAAHANELIRAKAVIPILFNTFPKTRQNPQIFVELVTEGIGEVMEIGEELELW